MQWESARDSRQFSQPNARAILECGSAATAFAQPIRHPLQSPSYPNGVDLRPMKSLSREAWNYFLSFNFLSDRLSDKKLDTSR